MRSKLSMRMWILQPGGLGEVWCGFLFGPTSRHNLHPPIVFNSILVWIFTSFTLDFLPFCLQHMENSPKKQFIKFHLQFLHRIGLHYWAILFIAANILGPVITHITNRHPIRQGLMERRINRPQSMSSVSRNSNSSQARAKTSICCPQVSDSCTYTIRVFHLQRT